MATDEHKSMSYVASPASKAESVTPDDSNDITRVSRSLYVGSFGDVKVTMAGGTDVTLKNVPAGALLPIRVTRVWATGTTASNIVALD